ncbi:MAG: AhpC/TSA family protein [Saprospiraceae bacterium]|nr:AhpC/TSA family protein [Saprospiraceae bacterium]MCB0626622.1 AhpC/TSA family protein [Saprospiraceae bacterium]MCB0679047.1 AhpC/TSA family protein [Saprospiraceae bacterium]MCB0682502.1 AhpC/TSA family protein [Saprospiraceae bacterium]
MYTTIPIEELLREMTTNTGEDLYKFSYRQPVMLVFLRHFGCIFCREALADISKRRASIEEQGTQIVFVHMSENAIAERYFQRYDLDGALHISDPECRYYAAFGLTKGTFTQLFGLQVWMRGFTAGVINGHGVGSQLGDGFQMPGVFIIREGEVREEFIHKLASDRPDYEELVKCCAI